jgi:hypothetical protein
MFKILEYLTKNDKYVVGLTIICAILKLVYPYLNIPTSLTPHLLTARTILNWLVGFSVINILLFFILIFAYKPKQQQAAKWLLWWQKLLMVCLPIFVYGGVLYLFANSSWIEIIIVTLLLIFNEFWRRKMLKKNNY